MRKLAAIAARFKSTPDPYGTAYDARTRLQDAGLDTSQVADVISAAVRDGSHEVAGLAVAYLPGRGFTVSTTREDS